MRVQGPQPTPPPGTPPVPPPDPSQPPPMTDPPPPIPIPNREQPPPAPIGDPPLGAVRALSSWPLLDGCRQFLILRDQGQEQVARRGIEG